MGESHSKGSNQVNKLLSELLLDMKAKNLSIDDLKRNLDRYSEIDGYNSKSNFIENIVPLLVDLGTTSKGIERLKSYDIKIYHEPIVSMYLDLFDEEEVCKKSVIESFLIPMIDSASDKDAKNKALAYAVYESLGKHKSLHNFIEFLRKIFYFYTKQLYTTLILETKDKDMKKKLMKQLMIHFNNSNFHYKYSEFVGPLVRKYSSDITVLELSLKEMQQFIIKHNISSIFSIVKLVEKDEVEE